MSYRVQNMKYERTYIYIYKMITQSEGEPFPPPLAQEQ